MDQASSLSRTSSPGRGSMTGDAGDERPEVQETTQPSHQPYDHGSDSPPGQQTPTRDKAYAPPGPTISPRRHRAYVSHGSRPDDQDNRDRTDPDAFLGLVIPRPAVPLWLPLVNTLIAAGQLGMVEESQEVIAANPVYSRQSQITRAVAIMAVYRAWRSFTEVNHMAHRRCGPDEPAHRTTISRTYGRTVAKWPFIDQGGSPLLQQLDVELTNAAPRLMEVILGITSVQSDNWTTAIGAIRDITPSFTTALRETAARGLIAGWRTVRLLDESLPADPRRKDHLYQFAHTWRRRWTR